MTRLAVVLFNLGGPDGPAAVEPFLFNLFNDPAIVGAPAPVRWCLAKLLAKRRAPVAREIYRKLGGASPLLPLTRAQAAALQAALQDLSARVFVAMRYWHPFGSETAAEVAAYEPEQVVLLPLYPQYSATTSGSSLADWRRSAARAGLRARSRIVCCYPDQADLVAAHAALIEAELDRIEAGRRPRLLFSAHGLPKKVIARGDPYQWQVERSAAAVARALGRDGLDWRVSYQSRVGPLEWIGPSTDDEIRRAGADGVPLVVAPIAFVSEHSETLVELDIEYARLAAEAGVPDYRRVPALGTAPRFIAGLAALVRGAVGREAVASHQGTRLCPGDRAGCPCTLGQ